MPGESSEPFGFIEEQARKAARFQAEMNDMGFGPDSKVAGVVEDVLVKLAVEDEADFRQHVVVFDGDLNWSIEHTDTCREHPERTMSQCLASQIMLATTMPPVQEPGRYRMRREGSGGMPLVLFDKDDNARPRDLIALLEDALTRWGGGQLVISSPDPDSERLTAREWSVALVMGREAEDSDMAGGAAYGIDPDLRTALRSVLDQAGIR